MSTLGERRESRPAATRAEQTAAGNQEAAPASAWTSSTRSRVTCWETKRRINAPNRFWPRTMT